MTYYPNKYQGIPYDKERHALEMCVDEFAAWMREKLISKLNEGYGGWDSRPVEEFKIEIRKQIDFEGFDPIDVALYAMFIWNQEAK
jgi:hypothetical protein